MFKYFGFGLGSVSFDLLCHIKFVFALNLKLLFKDFVLADASENLLVKFEKLSV